jgi:hypothetical protein
MVVVGILLQLVLPVYVGLGIFLHFHLIPVPDVLIDRLCDGLGLGGQIQLGWGLLPCDLVT